MYVKNLDVLSSKILYLYTGDGFKLINQFHRNKMLLTDKMYEDFIKIYPKIYKDLYVILMKGINVTTVNFKSVESFFRRIIRALKKIVLSAPKITRDFYVYRGINLKFNNIKEYYSNEVVLPLAGGKTTVDTFSNEAFTSTSAFISVAIKFSKTFTLGSMNFGTIFRYKIRSPCVLISNSKYLSEYEILLLPSEEYYIKKISTYENTKNQRQNHKYQ